MLRVNQLTGFGGFANPGVLVRTGLALNTNTPSIPIDLGPPGQKTVMIVQGVWDDFGGDPYLFGVGTLGGEALTEIIPSGQETAGNGSNYSGGATVRSIKTFLGGVQNVEIPVVGYVSVINETELMAVVIRGELNLISYDHGDNEGPLNAENFTLNTAGARLVVGGCAGFFGVGTMSGPGSEVTAVNGSHISLGYDFAPAGGASDVYSFTGANKYVIAGAAFG